MKIIFLSLLLLGSNLFSQRQKLLYKKINDSTFSVINENNIEIVPPFTTLITYNDKEEIKDNIIYIADAKNWENYYVDREGNYLFDAYMYDNGPDYERERSLRYKDKNGKVGLADPDGNILIAAKYDYLSFQNFGFSYYCNGCYFDRSKDSEHPPLVGAKTFGYVDRLGKEIQTNKKKNHPKDYAVEGGRFIPYQRVYTDYEMKILNMLQKYSKRINQMNISEGTDLVFEIITRPNPTHPYYFIKLYRKERDSTFSTDSDDAVGFSFLADEKGNLFINHLEHKDKVFTYTIIPLEDWFKP
ncbi:hypothetical protein [Chryseobacterium sp.]|uniref:hypothetical protein n=1 Tax=Chryseobacterium sp. TaxID=1871047 RepID=UPI00388EC19E